MLDGKQHREVLVSADVTRNRLLYIVQKTLRLTAKQPLKAA